LDVWAAEAVGPTLLFQKDIEKSNQTLVEQWKRRPFLERLREQLSPLIQYWPRLTFDSIYTGKEDGPIAKAQTHVSIFRSGGFHGVG